MADEASHTMSLPSCAPLTNCGVPLVNQAAESTLDMWPRNTRRDFNSGFRSTLKAILCCAAMVCMECAASFSAFRCIVQMGFAASFLQTTGSFAVSFVVQAASSLCLQRQVCQFCRSVWCEQCTLRKCVRHVRRKQKIS